MKRSVVAYLRNATATILSIKFAIGQRFDAAPLSITDRYKYIDENTCSGDSFKKIVLSVILVPYLLATVLIHRLYDFRIPFIT